MSLCPGKPFVPKSPAQEVPREEQVTLEPELEEALANATDAEMCDIAGGSHMGLRPPPGGHEGTGGVTGHPLTPPSHSHPGHVHADEQQAVLRCDLQREHHQHRGHQQ